MTASRIVTAAMKAEILRQAKLGFGYTKIAWLVGCGQSSVSRTCLAAGLRRHIGPPPKPKPPKKKYAGKDNVGWQKPPPQELKPWPCNATFRGQDFSSAEWRAEYMRAARLKAIEKWRAAKAKDEEGA